MPADRTTASRCVVRVPAKINLFLAVRGARPDGYHELTTVLQTVSVHDRVTATLVGPSERSQHPASRHRMRLELAEPDDEALPSGDANLAVRAARVLGRLAGLAALEGGASEGERDPRTLLELTKGIPVAGGMAGGSADAAAALVALNELWGCGLPRERLRDLGEEVGSDVPFCVIGGTALATGRGTSLARVLCRGQFHWVVVFDHEPLETPDVYRAWDAHCEPSEVEPDAVLQALRAEDALALGAALHNDLEPAAVALRPALADRKQALLDKGALGAVLSGSGPTLLALASDAEHARRLADDVRDLSAREPVVVSSPAGGPELKATTSSGPGHGRSS
ncbi:4-(cytidine 5'-diphospho)-2-C-methyl-D-erythritol kinase [Egibacter rhizosphaerae]|uniref:4-(cytidine 5'-diphospho)-2-C-methyl-D-erythritol kinase n=1 Tax=Egibacter rhizosphaerae TaxID=1670831 RepID=UPI0013F15B74|nr:4-(cytidine 5'-diphospho)-2-C-methyl-D-erythritol kinase [Egibacter rhizosphaerae]